MQFTRNILTVFILSAFLGACGVLPTKENEAPPEQGENQANAPQTTATESEAEPIEFVAIPKPQSNNSGSVPSQARDEFSKAKQAMIRKNWKEAEDILLLMSNTYPKLSGVYTNLGIVYGYMEKWEKAENAYRFAIQTNPLNFDAYTNLGVLLREQGKFEQAEQNYLAALEQWPHHQASLINLGILYDMYLGRLNEALRYYQLAQQLNDTEDRKLKGWIIDLQRRLPKDSAATSNSAT